MVKTGELKLRNLIDGFGFSCQTEAKSPKTVEWYTAFLGRFNRFLESNNLPSDVSLITKQHIRQFIRYLQTEVKTPYKKKPLSLATIQGYVRTLKVFFSWLAKENYLVINPTSGIPIPRAPIKIVNTFSPEHIKRLSDLYPTANGYGYRNLAIVMLLLDTGMRVSELVGIELDDINLSEGYIKIRQAKGNRERYVPVGSIVQKTLWKYINNYRPQPLIERITRLFLSEQGLPLTRSGIQQMLRRSGKRAGITGARCSPHTFRHTFAKYYLLRGGDIFSLQKILGHSSLSSVRTYLNLFGVDIKKQHQRFSPVDNLAENRTIYSLTH